MSLEEERLRSETARNRAERRKLLLEALETRQRVRRPWFARQYLLQTLVAGLIAGGLLVAWVVEYFGPILSRKTELQSINNEILTANNERLSGELADYKQRLQESAIALATAEETIARRYEELARSIPETSDEKERLASLAKDSSERAKRWQDDDFLFMIARARLESLADEAAKFELDSTTVDRLMLHEFKGDDAELQNSRLAYLRTVLLLLEGTIDHETAVAVWLAGVEQHNRSLGFHDGDPINANKHIEEIDAMFSMLRDLTLELPRNESMAQILSWLNITGHNMRIMRD